ncbi:MAG: OmpA family protein [Bacteroidales bacterium]
MSKELNKDSADNPFGMSIGDLMAALLLIFVLLLTATLLRLQDESDKKNQIVTNYNEIKQNLYNELYFTFKDDLTSWDAEIDSTELTIRFKEPNMLFDHNQSILKEQFKNILSDFFPRYIEVLTKNKFKDNIEEVRIEGHTDSSGDYYYNMKLSQDRTRSVLEYSMKSLPENKDINWALSHITANGLSSSKLIYNSDGVENQEASRRVEFRVKTNAEQKIEQIMESIAYEN